MQKHITAKRAKPCPNSTSSTQPARFTYLFLAVRRCDTQAKPHRQAIIAYTEQQARCLLVADYVLAFAGRVPVQGAEHD